MKKRCRVVILLVLAFLCTVAKGVCPQFEPGSPVGTVANSSLDEVSGIAASRQNSDVLWVHNDHGGMARVWALNTQGTHLGVYSLFGADDEDYEDIAIGPGPTVGVDYLYVGNIGDNSGSRSWIEVYRVAEPAVDSEQSPVVTTLFGVDTIKLQYPDGARDAETLMVDPVTKDIYIITKDESYSRVYRAPYPQSTTATITMEYKCELPWNKAAGGDISLDGGMVIVKTGQSSGNVASVWLRPAGTNLWDAFSGTECSVEILYEINGEAVCFDADGLGYYTTSEELYQPIHYFASVNSNLVITEVMSESAHSGGTNGDWWELSYTGSSTVDLTGYSWDDDSNIAGTVTFGSITIGPNESIVILDDDGSLTASWKSEWALGGGVNVYDQSYFSVFSGLDSIDDVYLYDPSGKMVSSVTYPGSQTGFSNGWDTNGIFLGFSVAGKKDAYQSTNPAGDVASPGDAVSYYSCGEADIYTDGNINFKDYAVLLNDWLKAGPSLDGDITGNSIVNRIDLEVMGFYWLYSCE